MCVCRTLVKVEVVHEPELTELTVSITTLRVGSRAGVSLTPAWKLLMPNQVVTSQYLTVLLRKAGDDITLSERELALRRLGVLPLLGVSRSDLSELVDVGQDSSVCRVRQLAIVGSRAKIQLPSSLHQLVEVGIGTGSSQQPSRDNGQDVHRECVG